ncbi:hypothetical protein BJF79_21705 [Actinomadura sp. CNU-125]|uniref:hypothetical protein n=1 Tax=Actinomadura sp. CNU-125 TaxID=1904961 RepID=UPI0009633C3E|nr:hypothetical protein [Actinomadura sp. CNU-125]OLT12717.1 hypothetical protein BJF79_21705 [Actinomadura sp. CNU-125]
MTPRNTTWVPLDVAEGIVEQAIREVLEPRFFTGTVAEVTAEAGRRMQELRAELGRLDSSHCVDGPITEDCPLECLRLRPGSTTPSAACGPTRPAQWENS